MNPCTLSDAEFRTWSAHNGIQPKTGDIVYKTKRMAMEHVSTRPDAQYAIVVPFKAMRINGWVIRPNKEYYARIQQRAQA